MKKWKGENRGGRKKGAAGRDRSSIIREKGGGTVERAPKGSEKEGGSYRRFLHSSCARRSNCKTNAILSS